ncbi:hypothetical protein Fmac_017896 [Flemingia macrophylla]|uniref:Uncharacterized protein n=1 Tax=Flemingia macrophylla TaxID=520843 RepID=A0ABD1M3D6_9FABA
MVAITSPIILTVGQGFVDLGAVMVSISYCLYNSEAYPIRVRDTLVDFNSLLIFSGHVFSYLVNFASIKAFDLFFSRFNGFKAIRSCES